MYLCIRCTCFSHTCVYKCLLDLYMKKCAFWVAAPVEMIATG